MKDGPRLIFAEFHLQRTFLRHSLRRIGFAQLWRQKKTGISINSQRGLAIRANLIFRPKVTGGAGIVAYTGQVKRRLRTEQGLFWNELTR